MLSISIDPVLLHLGHIEVRWYGIMIVLGVLVGLAVVLREAKRKGIPLDPVYDGAFWAIIGGLLGARLFHIVDFWDFYAATPSAIFSLQFDGLAIYGGLAGGLLAVVLYARINRLSFWPLADAAAVGLPLGQAIGRVGCLINGCNYGTPTSLPWGVVWTNPAAMAPINDLPRHPAQAYEAALALAIFGLVWLLRSRLRTDGLLFLTYATAYSAGRFALSFLREDNVVAFGLRQAQILGLAAIVLAVPLAWYLMRRRIAAEPERTGAR